MTHFYVDDQLPFHPKVIAAGNAAMGLWVRAGAYSKQHTTGGFVVTEMALAMGKRAEIDALVAAGLWISAPGGFQFHDWADVAGNSTADEEKSRRDAERERARQRKTNQRTREKDEGHAGSHGVTPPVTTRVSHGGSHGVTPPNVTAPPVPVPLTTDTNVRHVPNREVPATDDSIPSKSIQHRALAGLGITSLEKIKLAIGKHTGRAVDDQLAVTVIADLLDKGGDGVKNAQAYVMSSIEKSWPEVQKLVDQVVAA